MATTIYTAEGRVIGDVRVGDSDALRSLVREEYGTDANVTVYYRDEYGAWAWWTGGSGGSEGLCAAGAVPAALRATVTIRDLTSGVEHTLPASTPCIIEPADDGSRDALSLPADCSDAVDLSCVGVGQSCYVLSGDEDDERPGRRLWWISDVVSKKGDAMATDDQIQKLRREAIEAGDWMQTAICDMALGLEYSGVYPADDYSTLTGDESRRLNRMTRDEARAECERVIASVKMEQ